MYEHLRAPESDLPAQIATMEATLQKIRADGALVPPGFHAHLGYLYLTQGNEAKAMASLEAEREAFPEFGPYLSFLMTRNTKK